MEVEDKIIPMRKVTLMFPEEAWERVKKNAAKKGLSANALIRTWIFQQLDEIKTK